MLKPLCPKARPITPTRTSTFDASRNIYAPLIVEDLPEIPEIPATVPYKVGKKVHKSSYRCARADREIKFHIFLFLKFATSITIHVREQIKRYVAGEIPFDVFTTAWNVVIHLLRDLNEKFLEDVRKAEEGNLRPREFIEHSDILDYLHTAKGKAKTASKRPEDLCERTNHILQQRFTKPALDRMDPRSLGDPLEFLGDDEIALTYDEKVFLYSTTCLWAMIKPYKITKADDSDMEFRPEAEYGTGLNNLLPMVMIHMRKRGNVPTWVVYSLQMLMDAREEFGDHLNHALKDTVEAADWIGAELDVLLANCPSVMTKKELQEFRDALRQAGDDIDCSGHMEGMSLQLSKQHLHDENRKLYRNVPLMGGARAQLWLQQYHEIITNFSSSSGAIHDVAHLDNAARQSDMLSATSASQISTPSSSVKARRTCSSVDEQPSAKTSLPGTCMPEACLSAPPQVTVALRRSH
jgi:hypothetical protein